ncbi:MAG: tRNA (guanosine(46)-N7)-methyltransferase TrmB [Pseudomonadota bacterium]
MSGREGETDAEQAAPSGDERAPVPSSTTQTEASQHPRQVYVRRRGRMTRGQARALETLQTRFVIEPQDTSFEDYSADREPAPLGVEIGFGMGQALAEWALERQDWRLLGIEVYQPGIGSLLLQLEEAGATNVRVLEADAREIFERWLPAASVREIHIYFPDPWPKKRHASRRIVQPDTLAVFANALEPGGLLHLATDWQSYAEWMLECAQGEPRLRNLAAGFAPRPDDRPVTRFEARGQRLGHDVWDLKLERVANEP